ncbi:MAG: NADP-dependent isocitrate dehydrogenase [Campylobacteraceae bacterium]|jgi:isocitrate dehydrogenase|nr:NADP-dependent isocitrate dehydrogenase [Campylobacteraceae bacterium]MBT3881881.1 NADP-dependent isocitrate dehydrogenase [Campylobacteraceae bacterium]MBT4572771.1 NADP-dependent isocitrate dehydrogenase [Campylobacteraceae bacterium]MBT5983268.1 NADP-dependent isocitrate dehydrogenase [Campylobacteraceae bacterium]MBT6108134.1 NADP-dependent isocitrate dehydrogenase [Campylobacteraceae bacterium]
MSKIIWSKIDEAPALATYSLLPIVNAFTNAAGVEVVTSDISLAGRVLSAMGLAEDELSKLGEVVLQDDGNIIKLPNISASVGQLKDCIAELQGQGHDIPNYPENPANAEEEAIQAKYSTCLGSAVNPVLREGNSDRRAAVAVKKFAQNNPHKLRAFPENPKSYVAHMEGNGDFFGNEKSVTIDKDQKVTIAINGKELTTIDGVASEILDGTYMSIAALNTFYAKTIADAKSNDVLWSLHLKATMMKISDPIMFGHGFKAFFKDVFTKYADTFASLNVDANQGMSDLEKKIAGHADEAAIKADFLAALESDSPKLAMVDSDKGTTNFNASNDVIIDASMPVVVREGGKQWDRNGDAQECVAVIPDSTYGMFHAEMVADCVKNGQYDVTTMGTMQNIGLMAQKAEEYGSHPTTFELAEAGTVTVTGADGVLMSFECEAGDIWRMSRTKDIPIRDWVRLTVERTRLENVPAIFWLDAARAHDIEVKKKVDAYLAEYDTNGLDIQFMKVTDATRFTNARVREGKTTIAVTGNVLRDHLTDMYPILELGTSAKMLSIVPLIAGGGLYETGAGGSAPKHVDQFLAEGHLRWDSLGEILALAESLRFLGNKHSDAKLAALTAALDIANDGYLDNNKEPGRKCGQPDNKASHFFVAQYWAKALAEGDNAELAAKFAPVAKALTESEDTIMSELLAVEGQAQDIGGYFNPNEELAAKAMRPSATLNNIIDNI